MRKYHIAKYSEVDGFQVDEFIILMPNGNVSDIFSSRNQALIHLTELLKSRRYRLEDYIDAINNLRSKD